MNVDSDRKRRLHVRGGRDVSDAATAQGTPRIAGKLQKLRERQRANSLSGPPERTNTADSLTSDVELPQL